MKKTVFNGQVLSEKEMREVKGGFPNENPSKKNLKVCVACGVDLKGDPHPHNDGYRIFCYNCGTPIDVD